MNAIERTNCEILVDARCLQDKRFSERGIGQYVSVLLAGADRFKPGGMNLRLVAGVDRSLPALPQKYRALFADEKSLIATSTPDIFFQPSPMTHSPRPLGHVLTSSTTRHVAVVHDFIPLEFPDRYLSAASSRSDYFECLAALADFDLFVCNSQHTAQCTQDILGASPDDCQVSGVPVRESIIQAWGQGQSTERYYLVVAGDDDRKNVEAPIIAHARSVRLQDEGIQLHVVGHYPAASIERIRALHLAEGGNVDLLRFFQGIDDADLALQYKNALLTICPSRTEGFSIPVIEANANSCPVIVSTCSAQIELMPHEAYQFDPDDHDRLRTLMEALLDPAYGAKAMAQQGRLWLRFESSLVQQRCWEAIFSAFCPAAAPAQKVLEAPFVLRGRKPRIAVASPIPPDRSGVADYTAATMTALSKHANIDLYTETQGRVFNRAFSAIHPLSAEPYAKQRHDGLISVLGNSHLHTETFKLMLDYGGACIAHDARMVHFYAALMGEERTCAVASREMGRDVSNEEVQGWLINQRSMPILFLSEILEAAKQTFVHSATTKALAMDLYGRETVHLPFAIYRSPMPEFCNKGGRDRARALLGIKSDEKLLISLGEVTDDKALAECIWAVSMLNSWGVEVQYVIAGGGHPNLIAYLRSLVEALGLVGKVHLTDGPVDERSYQAYLAGADAAIQFRAYKFGGLSGALLDEIAFGVPTIANEHLAEAMESPSYVARVPDGLAPVIAAERLLEIFENGNRERLEEERKAFVHGHSVDVYAERLLHEMALA